MDDNKKDNNQIIDFSNQPLGLMAQEGAQIEENMNNEFKSNEEKRKANNVVNPNVQDNPFADISFPGTENSKKTVDKVEVSNVSEPVKSDASNTSIEVKKEEPTVQLTPTTNKVEDPPKVEESPKDLEPPKVESPAMPVEEKKPDAPVVALPPKGEVVSNNVQKEPGSWGIFVFLILIGIVGGAIFLFNSGKLDKLLSEEEETTEQAQGVKQEQEEVPKEADDPLVDDSQPETFDTTNLEPVLNYKLKSAEMVSSGDHITVNEELIVDLEHNTAKGSMEVNYNGVISKKAEIYCDLSKNITYSRIKGVWYKEKSLSGTNHPDDILYNIVSIASPEKVRDKNYIIKVPANQLRSIANVDSEYVDLKNLSKAEVTLEFAINDQGRLAKTRMDFSSAFKNINKVIVAQEFSDYNKNEAVEIPAEVVKTAKEIK